MHNYLDRTFISLFLEDYGQLRKTYTPENILTLGNRIRVVGDPGSGKSSLVKKLFRNECYHALKSRKDKSEFLARLPILIELRELVPPEKQSPPGEWLYEHIRALVIKSSIYDAAKFFDSYVGKDGDGLLVLLDGMDEVSSDFYLRIRQAISELSSYLQNCNEKNTIILTMRTQFHQQVQNEYRDSFGVAVYIKPFTPSDIYEFLSRWHFEQDAQSNIARIYSALTDTPTLREMCSNPLVLAMYVAEDQERGYSATPESRTEFYKRVTEELIIRRRLKQTGSVPSHTTAQRRRERVLGRIAYLHLLNEGESLNSLCWKSATKIVAEIFKCRADEAEQALQEIAKETGLITAERVGETFRFIHLTFCEFLGALEATERQNNGWHALLDAHQKLQEHGRSDQRSRLVEAIPFAAGLAPEKLHSKYLNDIEQLGDGSLLARCFLETKAYEHPAWSVFLDREKGKLQTIGQSKWSYEALEGLHIFSAVVNDAKKCEEHGVIIKGLDEIDRFFSSLLRGKEKNDLRLVMESYANQDAVAAFRLAELSGLSILKDYPDIVVENCAQPLFLALAVDFAKKDIENIYEWALIFFVAASTSSPALKNIFAQPAIATWLMPEDNIYNRQLRKSFSDGLLSQCIASLTINNSFKSHLKNRLRENRLRESWENLASRRILASKYKHTAVRLDKKYSFALYKDNLNMSLTISGKNIMRRLNEGEARLLAESILHNSTQPGRQRIGGYSIISNIKLIIEFWRYEMESTGKHRIKTTSGNSIKSRVTINANNTEKLLMILSLLSIIMTFDIATTIIDAIKIDIEIKYFLRAAFILLPIVILLGYRLYSFYSKGLGSLNKYIKNKLEAGDRYVFLKSIKAYFRL